MPAAQVKMMLGNPEYNKWCREGFCSFACFERNTCADEQSDVGKFLSRPDGFSEDTSEESGRSADPAVIATDRFAHESAHRERVEDRGSELLPKFEDRAEVMRIDHGQSRFLRSPKRRFALLGGVAFLGLLLDAIYPPWGFAIITPVTFGLMSKWEGRNPWGWGILAALIFLVVAAVADIGTVLLVSLVGEALP